MVSLLLKIKAYLSLGVIAALLLFIAYKQIAYKSLTLQRNQLQTQVAQLNAVLLEQNAAIKQWQREGEVLKSRVKQEEADIYKQQVESKKHVDNIMLATVKDDCFSAMAWFVSTINSY